MFIGNENNSDLKTISKKKTKGLKFCQRRCFLKEKILQSNKKLNNNKTSVSTNNN